MKQLDQPVQPHLSSSTLSWTVVTLKKRFLLQKVYVYLWFWPPPEVTARGPEPELGSIGNCGPSPRDGLGRSDIIWSDGKEIANPFPLSVPCLLAPSLRSPKGPCKPADELRSGREGRGGLAARKG